MTILPLEFIATDPNIRGGRPVVVGTGIRVLDIVALATLHLRHPAEIAADYDLTLAQVYAALSYYYSHKSDIDADLQRDVEIIRQAKERLSGK